MKGAARKAFSDARKCINNVSDPLQSTPTRRQFGHATLPNCALCLFVAIQSSVSFLFTGFVLGPLNESLLTKVEQLLFSGGSRVSVEKEPSDL